MTGHIKRTRDNKAGFTLVEVVLAIGILGVAVLALLGMFAPTMNNVKNVLDSDFAIAATGSINSYFEKMAGNNFDDVKDLIESASETRPSDTVLYVYLRNTEEFEEIYITTVDTDVTTDLKDGHIISSSVLRVEIYRMIAMNNYNYEKIYEEAYIPMLLKIFSAKSAQPMLGGSLLMAYPTVVKR